MREQPWHSRRITHEHEAWFKSLRDIHRLTSAALSQLKRPSSALDAIVCQELASLMDDTLPDDVLGRLEQAIWEAQALVFKGSSPSSELLAACAAEGGRVATRDWMTPPPAKPSRLEHAFAALSASALAGAPRAQGFLVKRSIEKELEAEYLATAYRSPFSSVREAADPLSKAHCEWMRGYVRALNPNLHFETAFPGELGSTKRCTIRLTYLN